jgi:hypothetical protein
LSGSNFSAVFRPVNLNASAIATKLFHVAAVDMCFVVDGVPGYDEYGLRWLDGATASFVLGTIIWSRVWCIVGGPVARTGVDGCFLWSMESEDRVHHERPLAGHLLRKISVCQVNPVLVVCTVFYSKPKLQRTET